MNPLLDIAVAPNAATSFWERGKISWTQVCAWVEHPRTEGGKDGPGYVLGILQTPRRTKESVVGRGVITLDADHLTPAMRDDLLARLRELGCAAVVYSTYSSTTAAPRLRVLLLPSRVMNPHEYRRAVPWLMAELGGGFDAGSVQHERFMYMPTVAPRQEFFSLVLDGPPLDVKMLLLDADLMDHKPEIPDDVANEVTFAIDTLDAIADLSVGARLPWPGVEEGLGWDLGSLFMGERLVQAHNSCPAFTLEMARAHFMEHAPASAGTYDRDHKWAEAVKRVGGKTLPIERPEDVFTAEVVRTKFDEAVEKEARRLRVNEAAREMVVRERTGSAPIPAPLGLSAFLAVPDETVRFRVGGIVPSHGRVVLRAPVKAGKTTSTANLLGPLADGDDFLGRFDTEPVTRVILIDNEMAEGTARSWLRDQNIVNTSKVEVMMLRGALSTFDILDPVVRDLWAKALGPADVLVFDCLRPALDALGLSEDHDAGRFLEALDELTAAAGIDELLVVHHMGHTGERSRGDSRILDWPDAVWRIVFENALDKNSPRYFTAYGRDVTQPEIRLRFTPENRHLDAVDGSRVDAVSSSARQDIIDALRDAPEGLSGAGLVEVTGSRDKNFTAARNGLVDDGVVLRTPRKERGGGWSYVLNV